MQIHGNCSKDIKNWTNRHRRARFYKSMPIPTDLKIILIGSRYLYNLIYNYDPEFMKYFKVFVDFDDEMNKTEENEDAISGFISYQCKKITINTYLMTLLHK